MTRGETPPFRPNVDLRAQKSTADVDPSVVQLMSDCWKEDPEQRPDFKQVFH